MARTGKTQRRRYTTARYAVASLITGEIVSEHRSWDEANHRRATSADTYMGQFIIVPMRCKTLTILRDSEGADHPGNAGKWFLHRIVK